MMELITLYKVQQINLKRLIKIKNKNYENFCYDNVNGNVSLEDTSILLIKEFEALIDDNRNKSSSDKTGKKRLRAFKEFKFIYLFFDWEGPYFQYTEQDKHAEAMKDSGLSDEEFDDPKFRMACQK